MVMMTNDGHDDNDGTCVLTEYLWFSAPPPPKKTTQTQKKLMLITVEVAG